MSQLKPLKPSKNTQEHPASPVEEKHIVSS